MHQILTGNKHPLYDHKVDDKDILIERLKKIKEVEPDKSLSKLAKNLFDRMMAVKMGNRYSAKDCL